MQTLAAMGAQGNYRMLLRVNFTFRGRMFGKSTLEAKSVKPLIEVSRQSIAIL